jgi:hypothetical protein
MLKKKDFPILMMMTIMETNRICRLTILISIILSLLAACAVSQPCPVLPSGSTASTPSSEITQSESANNIEAVNVPVGPNSGIYENSTYGFSINYPEGWILKEAAANDMNMVVGFLAPGGNMDNPANYIIVQVESLPSNEAINLDQYTNAITSNLKNSYKDFKLLSQSDVPLANLPGKEMLYTMSSEGTPYEILLKYAIKDNKAYVLTYYSQADSYSQFENDARALMSSFQFSGANVAPNTKAPLVTPLPFSTNSS